MKTTKHILSELVLPFLFCWFFMTVLVDIIAIPTVFRNISNLEEGGRIGMTIFGRFNIFENIFGILVLLGVLSHERKSKLFVGLATSLLILSFVYTFYMTPMIGGLSLKIHQVAVTDPMYEILKKEHGAYHVMYRNFDSIKLFALIFFSVAILRFNLKTNRRNEV